MLLMEQSNVGTFTPCPTPNDQIRSDQRVDGGAQVVAEQALEIRLLKKSMIADGGDDE